MNKKKIIYIGILFIVTVIVSITYFSYAYLTRVDEQHGKLNIVAGTLDYKITSSDLINNSITVSAGEVKEIEIKVKSLNTITSKYQLYTNSLENVSVGYLDDGDNSTGIIDASEEKIIKVVIRNNSDTNKTITFGVQGGLSDNTLVLEENRVAINEGQPICRVGEIWEFDYTGDSQKFTANCDGTYELEVWGAQGGDAVWNDGTTYQGGNGGYSKGEIVLEKGQSIYTYVGGSGQDSCTSVCSGGFNGGGAARGGINSDPTNNAIVGTGGGATHIALSNLGELENYESSRNEVLIVAGGGGGSLIHRLNDGNNWWRGYGGYAGGLESGSGNIPKTGRSSAPTVATQEHGGTGYNQTSSIGTGTFGAAQALDLTKVYELAGAGGGWYGGGASVYTSTSGGSGYIGGVTNGQILAGNQTIPTHDGTGTMTGNTGNGYAKITYMGTRMVTFDAGEGTTTEQVREVNYGSEIGNLPTPTRTNYTFGGWYLDDEFTNAVSTTYIVESNVTLYAKWTQIRVNVTLGQVFYNGIDRSMTSYIYTDVNGVTRTVSPSTTASSNEYKYTTITTLAGSKIYAVSAKGSSTIWEVEGITGTTDRVYFYAPESSCYVWVNCRAASGNDYGYRNFGPYTAPVNVPYCDPTIYQD